MIPVDQTQFKGISWDIDGKESEVGDCFRACIASIFEISIKEVPNFCAYRDWEKRTNKWLESRGLMFLEVKLKNNLPFMGDWGYHIISGPSLRLPNCDHSVVGLGGKMVHDPHPSRDGLKTWDLKYIEFGFFIWRKSND